MNTEIGGKKRQLLKTRLNRYHDRQTTWHVSDVIILEHAQSI